MELGARICTPRKPLCETCPVGATCRARAELDDPTALPYKAPKKKKPHYQVAAGVISKGSQLLIAQRPAEGMLGGLWEFPGGKQEEGETLEECLVREIHEELGIEIETVARLTSVDHAFSHFSITLHAIAARYISGEPQTLGCADWKWIAPEELDEFALPRADRLIVEFLRRDGHQMQLFDGGVDRGK